MQDKNNITRQAAVIPPVIIKESDGVKLTLFRIKSDETEGYVLEKNNEAVFTFQPWEFHVLNALFSFGGNEYATLLGNANDRFGLQLNQSDIEEFFARLQNGGLLDKNESARHPLTKPFAAGTNVISLTKKTDDSNQPQNKTQISWKPTFKYKEAVASIKSIPQKIEAFRDELLREASRTEAANENKEGDEKKEEKAEENDNKIALFNPTELLTEHRELLTSLKYTAYPLPLLLFSSVFILMRHIPIAQNDILSVFGGFNFIFHMFFGLFTVNALSVLTIAAVAHAYTATVSSINLKWVFGFIPRFSADVEDTDKLTRNQKLWLHAAPLITRLGIFSFGTLLWYHSRNLGGAISHFGTMLAFVGGASFITNSFPFLNNNGYRFMCELLNEKNLRGKSIKAILNKWHGNSYSLNDDSNILIAYALVFFTFSMIMTGIIVMLIFNYLNIEMGSGSVLVLVGAVIYAGFRIRSELKKINDNYLKAVQFERWRDRTLPEETPNLEEKEQPKEENILRSNLKRIAIVCGIVFLLLPYPYKSSGRITLMPATQQQISTDIEGIVSDVYFDGGEFLKKGTVIARLSVSDYESQLKILSAKLDQQKANIANLESKPTPEDLAIAQEGYNVANVKWSYSKDKCERQQKLFKSGAISLEAWSDIEGQCQIDKQRAIEADAKLTNVKSGTPVAELDVAKAALLPIQSEITMYEDKIERSKLKMPFDGRLKTLYLREQQGKFLDRGQPIAMAENSESYKATLEVPESEISNIKVNANVQVRTTAYPDKTFIGHVKTIESDVETENSERFMRMIITIDPDGMEMKSGMGGFAKVDGEPIAAWKVLSRSAHRFINTELWAWLS